MKRIITIGLFCVILACLAACDTYATGTSTSAAPSSSDPYSVVGAPTISAARIDSILCKAGSPACHTGQALYDLGVQYGIDPAFALAFFHHESSYGLYGVARTHLSLGNLRCENGYSCPDGYAAFISWEQGYRAWYILISGPLYVKDGLSTVAAIIPRYAPSADNNNESAYIQSVQQDVANYRSGGQP